MGSSGEILLRVFCVLDVGETGIPALELRLERALENLGSSLKHQVRAEFAPERDRLFALGDLVDRGPRSADALAWMERGCIALSVRGNHEQMLLERIEAAENDPDIRPWTMHPWFPRDVKRASWTRWKAMIRAMPIAATIRTGAGAVGLVHTTPTARHWDTMLAQLGAGDTDTLWLVRTSTARVRQDARRAEHEGVPITGPIDGVRAVLCGHTILRDVTVTGGVGEQGVAADPELGADEPQDGFGNDLAV